MGTQALSNGGTTFRRQQPYVWAATHGRGYESATGTYDLAERGTAGRQSLDAARCGSDKVSAIFFFQFKVGFHINI